MWDPVQDLDRGQFKDHPCNTHIYFRIREGQLTMTVCNRSNDVLWGMLGANVCHMTLLQELIANALRIPVGSYYVMTNNAHIYMDNPKLRTIQQGSPQPDLYELDPTMLLPPLLNGESLQDFLSGSRAFCEDPYGTTNIKWIDEVAKPMFPSHDQTGSIPIPSDALRMEEVASFQG